MKSKNNKVERHKTGHLVIEQTSFFLNKALAYYFPKVHLGETFINVYSNQGNTQSID